jgi:hypothetical protein
MIGNGRCQSPEQVVNLTMIKKTILCFCLSMLVLPQAFAEYKKITLKDGSVIRGELISFDKGMYTLKTDNLGQLMLPETNVVSVVNESMAPALQPQAQAPAGQQAAGSGNFSNKVSAMQTQIMNNPQSMQAIQAMAQDPEISAMMSDPTFVEQLKAAMSGEGDPQALANNPKIQKLMANPQMQSLIQQMQGTRQQQ